MRTARSVFLVGLTLGLCSPARAAELVVAGPTARALERHGVVIRAPVFAGHAGWRVWSVSTRRSPGALRRLPGVRWVERDRAFRTPRVAHSAAVSHAARSRSAARRSTRAAPAPAPPSGCAGGSGLAAGQPDDPGFCNEPRGPFYEENWNLFCFLPATQTASVLAASPAPPRASGICATGAWRLGAQGQGTVIAILDSGVDYLHPDLKGRMADESSVPALADSAFPGRASDGHVHGWNFYDDNAEPMDYYGHGTGRAGIAAAEADNKIGIAGAAPRARIMAVKVGDTYVVHAEHLAQGVVYAADHGADVINTSLGAIGNSRLLRLAAAYAETKGVFWAAATANEYSTHHNYPTNLDTVVGVGGVNPTPAPDQAQRSGAPAGPVTTFLQKTNYSNYGAIVDLVAPTDTPGTQASASACDADPLVGGRCAGKGGYSNHQSGTSTSTPHVAGAAALVRSAGFLAGMCAGHADIDGALRGGCSSPSLTPNEIRQLLLYTATKVGSGANYPAFSGSDPSLARGGAFYPERRTEPHLGWSMWTGYGRIDAYAATAYARAGLVPPEAQLYGEEPPPGNHAYDGLAGPRLFALIDPARTRSVPIVGHVGARAAGVTWKVQVAPCLEPAERDFSDVASGSGPRDGVLARWDPASVAGKACADAGPLHPFSPRGTVTIRVLASLPGDVADPTGGADPNGAPAPAPLAGQDRRVVYVRPADHDAPGSPFALPSSGEGSPTLYDLEGRGELDTIVPTSDGQVLVLRPDGSAAAGWPQSIRPLTGKGIQRVVGVTPTPQVLGSIAVGDVDGDGDPEVVAQSERIYAWHRDGTPVRGFPVGVPPQPRRTEPQGGAQPGHSGDYCDTAHPADFAQRFSDYGAAAAPVLADVNGDGRLDVVSAQANQCVYAVDGTGRVLWSTSPNATASDTTKIVATPAVGDMDGDGKPEVVVGTEEVVGAIPSTSGRLYALDGATGRIRPGWPVVLPSLAAAGVPTVASGVVSSPILYPAPGGHGMRAAAGAFLGGDPFNPVRTYGADGSGGQALDMTTTGAGSNGTDTPFHWGITQAAFGRLGESPGALVTGLFGNGLAVDTAADPSKKPSFEHLVGAWDPASGKPLATFPRQIEDWQFLSGPVIADVKGDGTRQVIAGSGGGYVHAFDPAGADGASTNLSTSLSPYVDRAEPAGFPVFTGGYITATPAVGQLRRGGPVTVATVTRDGYLFLTVTSGKPEADDQWWRFHHDERNTGVYGLDTRPPATMTGALVRRLRHGRARLSFVAVGDDWWVGRAAGVEVRWSRRPIATARAFAAAHRVSTAVGVLDSGMRRKIGLHGLPVGGRLYLALRATDDAGNVGLVASPRALRSQRGS